MAEDYVNLLDVLEKAGTQLLEYGTSLCHIARKVRQSISQVVDLKQITEALTEICCCGHDREEHVDMKDTLYQVCAIHDCTCVNFTAIENDTTH